MSYRKL